MAVAAVADQIGVSKTAPGPTAAAGSGGRTRDAFPHTRRPLPWLLAAFLTMLFFVPVDSTEVKIHLPVGSQIDRFGVRRWCSPGSGSEATSARSCAPAARGCTPAPSACS